MRGALRSGVHHGRLDATDASPLLPRLVLRIGRFAAVDLLGDLHPEHVVAVPGRRVAELVARFLRRVRVVDERGARLDVDLDGL